MGVACLEFCGENFSRMAEISQNSWKFSPSKVSRYTVIEHCMDDKPLYSCWPWHASVVYLLVPTEYILTCSDTGSYPPESCVFTFVLTSAAIIGKYNNNNYSYVAVLKLINRTCQNWLYLHVHAWVILIGPLSLATMVSPKFKIINNFVWWLVYSCHIYMIWHWSWWINQ